jgi:type IV pilus assembly protein PilC
MKFNYQARTKEGEIRAGQIEASSKSTASDLLQKNGLYVTFLEEAVAPIYAKKINIFQTISRQEIVVFSRLLAVMFSSKVPLMESLRVLSGQTKNPDFKEKILEISEEVEGGISFSAALSRSPKTFSPFYIAMVKSGEISGKLSEVLNYLATHLEKEYRLASKVKGALAYPSVIFFVIFGVMGIMIYYVIPQLSTVLEGSAESLPLITRVVIGFAAFAKQWGWVLILGFILSLVVSFRQRQKII